MFACIQAPECAELTRLAGEFSPVIENTSPGVVVLSIDGLERRIGTPADIARAIRERAEALGIQVRVGVAVNPEAAVLAAHRSEGVTVVPPGKEADALGDINVNQLPLPPNLRETLARWGIRTFAEFAALPPLGIVERFGVEGLQLQDIARGASTRPLTIAEPPPEYRERTELEYPIDLAEPLLFVVNRMMRDLCARLESEGLATSEIRLTLELEDAPPHERRLQLPVPSSRPLPLLKLLQLDLEARPPCAPIHTVTLELKPAEPRRVQNGLFRPLSPEPTRLEVTLARLTALVGEGNLGSPELLDTHRPDAYRLNRFVPADTASSAAAAAPPFPRLAIRIFRPARQARVLFEAGSPQRVAAPGITGNVIACAGPWRSSGEWWMKAVPSSQSNVEPWARDEWDVALTDGALYRISRRPAQPAPQWFVEGAYD